MLVKRWTLTHGMSPCDLGLLRRQSFCNDGKSTCPDRLNHMFDEDAITQSIQKFNRLSVVAYLAECALVEDDGL